MIPVTKPFLPPQSEYQSWLDGIWERNWQTNNGPLVHKLEQSLKEYLGMEHLLYTGNGTIAIQIAIKALELKGEIITTPFSYVATTSSIVWEGCKPVFVDIEPTTCNIDPQKIEAAITPHTSAILATHVYGIPCDVEVIARIAKKHNLKVIYDGAHAFGVKVNGRSIFSYGDVSTTSFHATKVFHTIEGGAVFTTDAELHKKMAFLRNFGHDGPERFNGIGVNGKNSEFHAAMGLTNFPHLPAILQRRREQSEYYKSLLSSLPITYPATSQIEAYNYCYFPIIFPSEKLLLQCKSALEDQNIGCRRYFYPGLNTLDYTGGACPVSDEISTRVLCLPLYHSLTREEQERVVEVLLVIARDQTKSKINSVF